MQNLSAKIGVQIKSVFQSEKISQVLVYKFQCDLCDTDYVGYTTRDLHQRIGEHKHSAIGRHLEEHGLSKSDLKDKQFSILRKCRTNFDCLIFEMLFIKELKPGLNTQKDSVRAKLFMWHCVQIFLAFNSVLFKSLRICFVHLYSNNVFLFILTWKWRWVNVLEFFTVFRVFLTVMFLAFVLSQRFIGKLLTKPILLRKIIFTIAVYNKLGNS